MCEGNKTLTETDTVVQTLAPLDSIEHLLRHDHLLRKHSRLSIHDVLITHHRWLRYHIDGLIARHHRHHHNRLYRLHVPTLKNCILLNKPADRRREGVVGLIVHRRDGGELLRAPVGSDGLRVQGRRLGGRIELRWCWDGVGLRRVHRVHGRHGWVVHGVVLRVDHHAVL